MSLPRSAPLLSLSKARRFNASRYNSVTDTTNISPSDTLPEARRAALRIMPLTPVKTTSAKSVTASVDIPNIDLVLQDICAYKGQGTKTIECEMNGVPYYINSFWRPNAGGSHALQKGPYHACFSGNLAEFVIGRFSCIGATVHDPHLGRGTTAIQSALMGRVACGSDINPVSLMMARPRLGNMTIEQITLRLDALDLPLEPVEHEDLLAFYHPQTLQQLEAVRRMLAANVSVDGVHFDPVLDWIRMALIFRITGHTSAYCSRETAQPNQPTPTLTEQRRRNERTGLPAPERDLHKIVLSRSRGFLRDGCVPNTEGHRLAVGAAWDTPWIEDASIDLVLTSPPFANLVNYKQDNWLRAWFAGISLDDVAFSNHASLADWTAMIRRILTEQMRIVKPGGYIAIEVGEIDKGSINLERLVWNAAEGLPCHRIGVIINQQAFTKSAHTIGVTNGKRGTNSNRIVIIQRN